MFASPNHGDSSNGLCSQTLLDERLIDGNQTCVKHNIRGLPHRPLPIRSPRGMNLDAETSGLMHFGIRHSKLVFAIQNWYSYFDRP